MATVRPPLTRLVLVFYLCFSTWVPKAHAQDEATISGQVVDATGAAVPGATVEAVTSAAERRRSATTDARGGFSLTDLPPGDYTVSVSLAGFQTLARGGLLLTAGQTMSLTRLREGTGPHRGHVPGGAGGTDEAGRQVTPWARRRRWTPRSWRTTPRRKTRPGRSATCLRPRSTGASRAPSAGSGTGISR